jgi:hypothetical protein
LCSFFYTLDKSNYTICGQWLCLLIIFNILSLVYSKWARKNVSLFFAIGKIDGKRVCVWELLYFQHFHPFLCMLICSFYFHWFFPNKMKLNPGKNNTKITNQIENMTGVKGGKKICLMSKVSPPSRWVLII